MPASSFHGLRKSAVVTLLEAGCSDAEVAAITGQSRQMIEHYAKQVTQKLAASAILKWARVWERWFAKLIAKLCTTPALRVR